MTYRFTRLAVAVFAFSFALSIVAASTFAAGKTELVQKGNQWQLVVDGKPFQVKGAGGDASKELLAKYGGNSFRTWGVGDQTQRLLDQAQRLGLKVTVGIWLGHERHGFNYNDLDAVARQVQQVRQAVLKYKDHPAVLMWGLGNEMEGYANGDNAAIWSHIQALAAMVHELDPNHPTMTTITELGGRRVEAVHKLCPDIDIVGINSYAGVTSVPERYRKAGGTKPYIVTEFGPAGTWEIGRNGWGAVSEPPSTAKAASYRNAYRALEKDSRLCLGSYAFTWGYKQEATATWYGMFLDDQHRVETADEMMHLWTGKYPANRCPQIGSIDVTGSPSVEPGATVNVKLDAKDPEGKPLKVKWVLSLDPMQYDTGGDNRPAPPAIAGAIVKADAGGAQVKMPTSTGAYRLFVNLYDDAGGAATANVPLQVRGNAAADSRQATPAGSPTNDNPQPAPRGSASKLPFAVYGDTGDKTPFIASGWMGDTGNIGMDEGHTVSPHGGRTCIKVEYRSNQGWGGVVWQSPANDWGDQPGGVDLTGATKLTFYAKGQAGGEKVKFGFGLIGRDKQYYDTAKAESEFTLTNQWKQYTIDLSKKDLSRIKTGFMWVVGGQGDATGITFYLDDIRYE